jgi:hypothetical protein
MTRISLLIALLLLTFSGGAQTFNPTTDGRNPFGIVEAMWFPERACDLGVGWERIIFDWAQHQPESAEDWNTLNVDDRWLRAASDCGREIVAVVKNVPAWATDGQPGIGVPRGLDLPLDDPGNVWAGFMRKAARYYATRGVHRFIILNEPDIDSETYGYEFEGSVEDYAAILKTAYFAAREGNPAARVHLAGTTFWHDIQAGREQYLVQLLDVLEDDPEAPQHGYYFDAVSLHIYFRSESIPLLVGLTRQALQTHGLENTPIWINETNTSPNLDPNWPVTRPQFQVTVGQQSDYLIQAAALALASGVERMAVYKLWDQFLPPELESFGLLTPGQEDRAPRPAYFTWRAIVRHFQDVVATDWSATPTVYVVRLKHADGHVTLVMWARTAQATTVGLTTGATKLYQMDVLGNLSLLRTIGSASMPADQTPPRFRLPGATCDQRDGCAVGGTPVILMLPEGVQALNEGRQALVWQTSMPESSVVIAR